MIQSARSRTNHVSDSLFAVKARRKAMEEPFEPAEKMSQSASQAMQDRGYYQAVRNQQQAVQDHHRLLMNHHKEN
jgi:hypothetical protein